MHLLQCILPSCKDYPSPIKETLPIKSLVSNYITCCIVCVVKERVYCKRVCVCVCVLSDPIPPSSYDHIIILYILLLLLLLKKKGN